MASRCYPCDHSVGPRPGSNSTGDPEGACAICGVLACQGHGRREINAAKFQCVICIPIVVAASVAATAKKSTQLAQQLSVLLEGLGASAWLISTVADFVERYPEFSGITREIAVIQHDAPHAYTTNQTEPFYSSLDSEQQALLLLAILIILRLEIPTDLLPEPLQTLVKPWRQ